MILTVDDLINPVETGNHWIDSLITTESDHWNMNFVGLFRPYITYSFNSFPYVLDIADFVNGDYQFLNIVQIENVRKALTYLTDLLSIEFVEVNAVDADWYFFNGDYHVAESGAAAVYAVHYEYDTETGTVTWIDYDGAIIFDNVEHQLETRTLAINSYGYEVLLHELGHLLGLVHPFDPPVILSQELDSTANTLMSYNSSGTNKTAFSPFDVAALLYLYGNDGLGGTTGYRSGTNLLLGTQAPETIKGSDEVDIFMQTRPGDDELVGLGGIDVSVYEGSVLDYSVLRHEKTVVIAEHASARSDTLIEVERVQFTDKSLAFDLDGNAGDVIRLLGVMLGKDNWYDPNYVGIGIDLLESAGVSYEALFDLALEVVLGPDPENEDVFLLVFNNVVGIPPTPEETAWFTTRMDDGLFTQAELAIAAATHPLNLQNIDLVGFADYGVEYYPVM